MSICLHIAISDATAIAVPAAPTSTVAEVIQAAVLRAVQAGFLSDDEQQQQQRFVLCGEKKTVNNNNFDKKPPVLFFDSDTLQDLSAEDGWHLRLLRRNKPGSAPSATQIPLFNVRAATATWGDNSNSAQSQRFPLNHITIPDPGGMGEFPLIDPLLEIGRPEDYEIFCDASVAWRESSGCSFGFIQVLQTVDTKHLPPHERTLFFHFRSLNDMGSTTALQTERIERPPVNLMLNGFEAGAVFPFAQFLKFVQGACNQDQRLSVTRVILDRYEQELKEHNVHPSQTQHRQQHTFLTAAAQQPPEPAKKPAVVREPVRVAIKGHRDTPQHREVMRAIEQGRIIRCADSTIDEALPVQNQRSLNPVEGYKFEIPIPGASPKAGRTSYVVQLLTSSAFGGGFRVFTLIEPRRERGKMSGVFQSAQDALVELDNELVSLLSGQESEAQSTRPGARKPVRIAVPSHRDSPRYHSVLRAIEQGRVIRCADSSIHEAVPPSLHEGWNAVEGFRFEVPVTLGVPSKAGNRMPHVVQLLASTDSNPDGGFRVFTLTEPQRGRGTMSGVIDNLNDALTEVEKELAGYIF